MNVLTAKRVVLFVISLLAMSSMAGCARIAGVSKSPPYRPGYYYPTALVDADRALDDARAAGKDKECPEAFNAVKAAVDNSYQVHLGCRTDEAIRMAKEAAEKAKALCPPRAAAQKAQEVPAAEPTPEKAKYCVTLRVLFDTDKAAIRDEYHDEIGRVATFMSKFPGTTAVIEGHTDAAGSADHNMRLSQERAESVVTYLVDKFGIERARLTAKGYGDTRPVADNGTEEGRQKNRRVEAIIDCTTDIRGLQPPPDRLCLNLRVQFDTDKSDIKPEYVDEIANVAVFMKENPTVTALVEGHTDNVGSAEYNMGLSRRRAESVVNYLADKFGIERSRLAAKGYGETRRIAPDDTPAGRAKNRRVNVILDCVLKK